MPWTFIVTLDADKADVGTVHGVFVEPTDAEAVFEFTERVRITATDRDAYLNRAFAARQAWRTRRAAEASYKANVEARAVATDPNPSL